MEQNGVEQTRMEQNRMEQNGINDFKKVERRPILFIINSISNCKVILNIE